MNFIAWFQAWLLRHPLKEPTEMDRVQYTADVMAKVHAARRPTAVVSTPHRRWLAWPRLAVVTALVAASVLMVVNAQRAGTPHLATELRAPSTPPNASFLLAESPPSDPEWVGQTLQLLDQLDEEAPANASDDSSDEEWIKELELLDDSDLASISYSS